MRTKHAQPIAAAPWRIDHERSNLATTTLVVCADNGPVAEVYEDGASQANSRLIAIVPELLSMVQDVWRKASNHEPITFDDCNRMHELIAKAEGRQCQDAK